MKLKFILFPILKAWTKRSSSYPIVYELISEWKRAVMWLNISENEG